nr:Phenylpropionate dioxygenase [Mycobacterium pseudoshottsii]
TVTNSIVLQIARAYTPAPIARHQRSSTQLTSLLINNAGALGTGVVKDFPLCDQEILLRHLHKMTGDYVKEYRNNGRAK